MHYRTVISIFKENFITETGFFFTWIDNWPNTDFNA
jgi:hypothetical protein